MTATTPPWFPIRTDRLSLRPFTQGDFDAVHAYANDQAVIRFMDWGPNTIEHLAGAHLRPVFLVIVSVPAIRKRVDRGRRRWQTRHDGGRRRG